MKIRWKFPRILPWQSPYPLPQDTAEALLEHEQECLNLGLLMERYLAYTGKPRNPVLVKEFKDHRALRIDLSPLAEEVGAYLARWQEMAEELGAVIFEASPEWRVVIGLGRNALLESGMALHHVFGFPIIPASALKGVTRLYAEEVLEIPEEEATLLFGQTGEEPHQGELIFLEGVPVEPPRLKRDLINPHMARYYGGTANVPPADYLNPSPAFFLTVARGSRYRFGVASSSGDRATARKGAQWLQEALSTLGIGAKTRSGYGYWVIEGGGETT